MATRTPLLRVGISPLCGPYSLKMWDMMPWPLVQFTRSVSKPMRPRVGMTACTVTLCGLMLHVDDVGFAAGEDLEDVAEVFVRDIDVEGFVGLEEVAVVRRAER